MPIWNQISFQDANSALMELMIFFHDHVMIIIMEIVFLIMYSMLIIMSNKFINRFNLFNHLIETLWTLYPVMFLLLVAFPSLKILYLTDEDNYSKMSIKVIGRQWFWSYQYNDFELSFDSLMKINLNNNEFRNLEVDNRMIIPYNYQIRMIINSSDVIHSFTIPTFGIKIDAVPGRLNQIGLKVFRPGVFYGQCSEICGVNHSFMPIVVEVVNMKLFIKYIKNF